MDIKEGLRHPIRNLRTAPIPIGGIAINSCFTSVMVATALETDNSVESLSWGTAGLTALLALRGVQLASGLINKRDRLEDSLERRGFNERIFDTTTEDWCTRQAALVACEPYNAVDNYEQLCERNQEDSKFTWIPHI